MTVQQLVTRIMGLSHNENAPDTALQEKALEWLNSAYFELLTELQPFQTDSRYQVVNINTNTVGVATLTPAPQRVLQVRDITHGTILNYVGTEAFLEAYPFPTDMGQPQVYRVHATGVEVYPLHEVQLQITYVPQPTALTLADSTAAIEIAPMYHDSLVWGALVWGSLFERDFSARQDIQLFQNKWEESKRAAKLSLIAGRQLRTQPMEG